MQPLEAPINKTKFIKRKPSLILKKKKEKNKEKKKKKP